MRPLTKRQAEIVELIKDHIQEFGVPPTRVEIAKKLGFRSANAAEEHLKAIAKKGAIEIVPGASRGIRIPGGVEPVESGLPLIGQVAAGEPILAQEHVESYHRVDGGLFRPSADFLLRVNGMSMKDIGILDGDLLAVHKAQTADNGQVVVARVEDDVTVKRFEHSGNKVLLHAENEEFNTIEVDLSCQAFAIEGIAVGVIRSSDWM